MSKDDVGKVEECFYRWLFCIEVGVGECAFGSLHELGRVKHKIFIVMCGTKIDCV